jgi:DNA-binding GntR family transcriptional regulator
LHAVVTAQQAAISELRDRIATGRLHPGDQILQEAIAGELGLSVVPIREALKTLEAEGQVVYAPHRGYFVARLDANELVEAYRIRELLESEAVAIAVPLLGEEEFTRLDEAIVDIERFSKVGDIVSVSAANRLFHFTFFETAALPRLVNFIRILWEPTDPYRSLYFADPAHRRLINKEHRAIVAAAKAGDVERTLGILRAHRQHALDSLCAILGDAADEKDAEAPRRRSAKAGS